MVTHDPHIASIAKRVIHVADGKVVLDQSQDTNENITAGLVENNVVVKIDESGKSDKVKAFLEEPLMVPAVIRLGGNSEDKAVEILERVNGHVPAPVEGYRKDDSPQFCAQRLKALSESYVPPAEPAPAREKPVPQRPYTFETVTGGTVTYDHAVCATCESKICVEECVPRILTLNEEGCPELNIALEDAKKGRCIECLACDVACYFQGAGGGYVDLPIPGLEE